MAIGKRKIYLINQAGTQLYKIGCTKKEVEQRIKELQTGNANELRMIDYHNSAFGYKLESALHAHFKSQQVNSEWFELTEEQAVDFVTICLKYENMFTMLREAGNPFI